MGSHNVVWLRISGMSGILSPMIAFTMISLAIFYSPRFVWTDNALSDLGVQEGITAPLFNYGLMIGEILSLIFASGVFALLSSALIGKIGAFIFILDSLAMTLIGVFPESVKPTHFQVSVAFFVLYPISMIVIGTAFMRMNRVRMGVFTFLTASVAAAVWIIYYLTHFVSGVAIPETVSSLSASMWAIVLGRKMLENAHK